MTIRDSTKIKALKLLLNVFIVCYCIYCWQKTQFSFVFCCVPWAVAQRNVAIVFVWFLNHKATLKIQFIIRNLQKYNEGVEGAVFWNSNNLIPSQS